MTTITADVKTSFPYKLKRCTKKVVQCFYMPKKDLGKKQYYRFLSKPVLENHVFYEAFAGLGILDNPRAIFKHLLSDPDFNNYTHVWSVDNPELAKANIEEFASLSNVIIVKKDSRKYYRYLATCKYLISNSTFGYFFKKRTEQVYINTWHGVPTKYMGYEHTIERVENARGPARNFLAADYIVSANRFMTDVMYRRAYKLDGLFEGTVLETGHPRSDSILNADTSKVYEKLNALGIDTDKKIILYAPTWKGNLYNQLDYDVESFKQIVNELSSQIDTNNYRVYLRVHYFLYKILAKDAELSKILIPFTIDTNELLSVVDVLISDYSSIFFDFLATKRPMIFYVPDLKEYESGRGLYVPVSKLPGLVSSDIKEVAAALGEIYSNRKAYRTKYSSLYDEMCEWCIYNDDGHSCERLVDVAFKGKDSQQTIKGFPTNKKRILICINTRLNNSEFYYELKDELAQIDYEQNDVTLLVTSFKEENLKTYFNTLPEQVRILVWYALPFVTKNTEEFYRREFVRSLGNVHFDEVRVAGKVSKYWAEFVNQF